MSSPAALLCFVFRTPHAVHRLAEQLRDVIAVIDAQGLRHFPLQRLFISGTHVQSGGFDFVSLLRRQAAQRLTSSFRAPFPDHFQDAPALQIVADRGAVLSAPEALVINAREPDVSQGAPLQPAVHGPPHGHTSAPRAFPVATRRPKNRFTPIKSAEEPKLSLKSHWIFSVE
jgi:hypothetical protein